MEFSTLEIFHAVAPQQSVTRAARQAMKPEAMADRLRIGAMESTAAARLPGLLSAYHSRWPHVVMDMAIGTSRSLLEDVLHERLDCAFVAEAAFQGMTDDAQTFASHGLQATRAYTEEMLLVLPPNHPPIKRPRDIQLDTLAVFPSGCAYRGVLERWLGTTQDASSATWHTLELTSYHAILASVAAGSCFALCPRSVLEAQRAPLDIVTRPIATVDTFLVARAAFSSGAYEELVQYVRAWASKPT
jgi:DNA-binding transcriptional LysR family regulator